MANTPPGPGWWQASDGQWYPPDASHPPPPPKYSGRSDTSTIVLSIVLAVLFVLFIAYVSLSQGIDYVHGFGKACLVFHDGWNIHVHCGSVSPPSQ